ncbi:hypothetical protein BZM27_11360 [Paraburkholderia steynii]|uniref:Porin n=1 Tax=Paraburkholderia steynii TaxID=1245441 RepID=A0A4R0XPR5_9BURK|nr:hypothetical protein BZM27_11360 [Paraburkholderia steynii]
MARSSTRLRCLSFDISNRFSKPHEVPVQAVIGASSSFIGNSGTGANSQLAVRVGLRHLF